MKKYGMNLKDIFLDSHAIAVEKGWWEDGKERDVEMMLLLANSEISEAVEEMRRKGFDPSGIYYSAPNHPESPLAGVSTLKPEGFAVELADYLIRVGDLLVGLGWVTEASLAADLAAQEEDACHASMGVSVNGLLLAIMTGTGLANSVSIQVGTRVTLLLLCAHHVVEVSRRMGVPLERALDEKMAFNRTRPYRHGGLRA